jgi:eukaryotic-like serine/threonine-protein kinase
VLVLDGDLRRRVRGAVVRIEGAAARTDRRGIARVAVGARSAAVLHVSARGYKPVTTLRTFRRLHRVIVRVYQPRLQWLVYGATAARTGTQRHIRLRPPFRMRWTLGMHGLIEFPAVVSDGVAYIGNRGGTIRAISMRFGKTVWRHVIPHGEMASSPAVVGKTIVVHGMDGHVWVLDRRRGRLLWRYTVGSPIESSPVVRGGVDYFGAWNGTVYALDLRRHRLRWTYRAGSKLTASATLGGRSLYIGDYGGRLLALFLRTGRLRFARSALAGRIYGTAALAGGRLFVPSSDGDALVAFSTRGARLWSVHTGAYVYSSPATWGGRVFFGSYNGVFYCVSARSGRILWTVRTGGPISGAASVVDGIAYAGSFAHRIVGVDARTGRVVFNFAHGEYAPLSGNGFRLLLDGYSRIFAVEPRRRRR